MSDDGRIPSTPVTVSEQARGSAPNSLTAGYLKCSILDLTVEEQDLQIIRQPPVRSKAKDTLHQYLIDATESLTEILCPVACFVYGNTTSRDCNIHQLLAHNTPTQPTTSFASPGCALIEISKLVPQKFACDHLELLRFVNNMTSGSKSTTPYFCGGGGRQYNIESYAIKQTLSNEPYAAKTPLG
jgi:hypothetical protein